ncbi:TIGR02611 family protein [Frondihabitans peucedani]|uniref:TIGR02611 family protein n=1 Tax=Frondihabitans peucedani TaxID=598626 RepID=A0ABP8DX15_9MICO
MSLHDEHHGAHHHRLRNTRIARRARLFRARLNGYPRLRLAYKVAIGVVGIAVVIAGVILIPLPGPGWLIVFLGLAILGTEFPAAHRLNMWAQSRVKRAIAWLQDRRRRRAAARSQRAATGR